jgi:predicted acylesterase/phospholipase RssA
MWSFEGGGVKGIGLVGAVAVAEERGYQWVNVGGTSAGAIVAFLLAAGYSASEIKGNFARYGGRYWEAKFEMHRSLPPLVEFLG